MPARRSSVRINSPEEHQRAVEDVQRLENSAANSATERRRAALLAAIQDYQRRLEEKDLRKGRPKVDKRGPGGRRR